MAEDEKDLGIDLKALYDIDNDDNNTISFDDVKDAGLDDFLEDVVAENKSAEFSNATVEIEEIANTATNEIEKLQETTPADFANFDIDDFDAALNSFQAARAGKLAPNALVPPPMPEKKEEPKPEPVIEPIVEADPVLTESEIVVETEDFSFEKEEDFNISDIEIEAPVTEENTAVKEQAFNGEKFNPATVDESNFVENTAERQQEILDWYSGELKDKSYKVSPDNMPEFLDTDKTIRVIHVTTESCYGWNVFFDNGVFMNLRDLKEYQERHGEMPYQDGKIIYGNKTINFERIRKIVVYEKPRYFSYIAK